MTDECSIDFESMDHEELAQLAENMHANLHAYADEQEEIRQWVGALGYALDTFAGEVTQYNRFGIRKKTMDQIPVNLANIATLAYRFAGVTRSDVVVEKEFADIVENFNLPAADKE